MGWGGMEGEWGGIGWDEVGSGSGMGFRLSIMCSDSRHRVAYNTLALHMTNDVQPHG